MSKTAAPFFVNIKPVKARDLGATDTLHFKELRRTDWEHLGGKKVKGQRKEILRKTNPVRFNLLSIFNNSQKNRLLSRGKQPFFILKQLFIRTIYTRFIKLSRAEGNIFPPTIFFYRRFV